MNVVDVGDDDGCKVWANVYYMRTLAAARAPIKAVSEVRTEVSIATIDISLFGTKVKTIAMEPKPGRGAGWVEQLYLDDDMRISAGNKGSVFVHVKDADAGGGGGEEATTTSASSSTASTSLAIAKTTSTEE